MLVCDTRLTELLSEAWMQSLDGKWKAPEESMGLEILPGTIFGRYSLS